MEADDRRVCIKQLAFWEEQRPLHDGWKKGKTVVNVSKRLPPKWVASFGFLLNSPGRGTKHTYTGLFFDLSRIQACFCCFFPSGNQRENKTKAQIGGTVRFINAYTRVCVCLKIGGPQKRQAHTVHGRNPFCTTFQKPWRLSRIPYGNTNMPSSPRHLRIPGMMRFPCKHQRIIKHLGPPVERLE